MGDHFHWRKCTPYEGSTRIPMVFRWPHTWEGVKLPRGSKLDYPVELRDVLPTFLDAARIPIPNGIQLDGQSFLLLLDQKFDQWRPWLDLEHDDCYGPLNRWNAGTDGHWKYVFRATVNEELLFNLDKDPEERFNLATRDDMKDVIQMWRKRIVQQFEREKRGEFYTINGTLAQRNEGRTFSFHYDRPITHLYWKPSTPEEEIYGHLGQVGNNSKSDIYSPRIEFFNNSEDHLSTKLFYLVISSVVAFIAIRKRNLCFFLF